MMNGRWIEYECDEDGDGVGLRGWMVEPDEPADARSAVLVFPEWWGIEDHVRSRAERLAGLGHVAFVADMYGAAHSTDDPVEAAELAGDTRTGPKSRARSRAAFDLVAGSGLVDADRIGAIGYCFGGSVALELARSGAPLRAVVSFHGSLATPMPAAPGQVRAQILVCHGGADPLVPFEQVVAFQDEMAAAGCIWEMVSYGGAQHSFSNPNADRYGIEGVAYQQRADQRSWSAMLDWFDATIGE